MESNITPSTKTEPTQPVLRPPYPENSIPGTKFEPTQPVLRSPDLENSTPTTKIEPTQPVLWSLDRNGPPNHKRTRIEESLPEDVKPIRHFEILPFELLAEILVFTESPRDVLAVARCSKFLCTTLLYPTSAFIWKSVRKSYPVPPPEPMSIFTEASYAAYLFGGGPCEVCRKKTEALYCSFGTRLRLCHSQLCKTEWVRKEMYYRFTNRLLHEDKVQSCLPYFENNECLLPNNLGRIHHRLYRASDVVSEIHKCATNPVDYQETKIAFTIKYMEFCTTLYTWKATRQAMHTSNERDNERFGKELAEKYGWVYWDLMNSTVYGTLHRLKNSRIERVTQQEYNNISSDVDKALVKLAENRERKTREGTYSKNRGAVEQHYQRLRSEQPPIILPSLEVFRRFPIIGLLQGTSPVTVVHPPPKDTLSVRVTLRKENWVTERLNLELRQWTNQAKKDLSAVLGFPNWTTASSKILNPVDRVTARFLCKVCAKVAGRYREDACLNFAGACAHVCTGTKKNKKVDGIWTAEKFEKDEKAIATLQTLLVLCGADALLAEASIKLKNLDATILCRSCQLIMDSRSVVGHSHRHAKMKMKLLSKDEATRFLLHPFTPFIVHGTSGATSQMRAIRSMINFGCRHCCNSQREPFDIAPEVPANSHAKNSNPVEAKSKSEKGTEKRFSFPGITSHLKEKHGVLDVRDEDIFSFSPIEPLPIKRKL